MKNPMIDGVEILGVTIKLYGELDRTTEHIDLGAVTIKRGDREYILDIVQSYTNVEGGFTTIETDLERDDDTFPDCPYNITASDLMSNDVSVDVFIDGDFSQTIEHMTLFVRFNGGKGMTKAIDVVSESDLDWDDEDFDDVTMKPRVEITNEFVRIYEGEEEIVGWVNDEWEEDPTILPSIANAIHLAHTNFNHLKKILGK